MDEHNRGGICVGPAGGWVYLGVDSFAVVGVDVSLGWLHGRCVGAGWSVRTDHRYTYTYTRILRCEDKDGRTPYVKLPRRSPTRNSQEWRESHRRVLIA